MSSLASSYRKHPALADYRNSYELKWLPLDSLQVPIEYQRDLDQKRVQRIADNLNPLAVGALLVSKRRSKTENLFLIDGEHRKGALYICGHTHWHCVVIKDPLTVQEEADIWYYCNRNRRNGSALQLFNVDLLRCQPYAVDSKRELNRVGWEVPRYSCKHSSQTRYGLVYAAAELHSIYNRIGCDGLRSTIHVAHESWGRLDDRRIHEAVFLRALSLVVATEKFQADPVEATKRLIQKLSKIQPSKLEQKAKQISQQVTSSTSMCLAVEFAKVYNKGVVNDRRIVVDVS